MSRRETSTARIELNNWQGPLPPPLTPPHKGEGNFAARPSTASLHRFSGYGDEVVPLPLVGRGKGWGYEAGQAYQGIHMRQGGSGFYRNRSICFYAFPDAKPLRTFAGNAPSICFYAFPGAKPLRTFAGNAPALPQEGKETPSASLASFLSPFEEERWFARQTGVGARREISDFTHAAPYPIVEGQSRNAAKLPTLRWCCPDTASARRRGDRRCSRAPRSPASGRARRSGRSTGRAVPGRCASGTAGPPAPRSRA